MGSNLRRQLREALPPSIKGLQRAVALEIADDARYDDEWNYAPEAGRRSKVRLADLVRWTAAKDELSVREMLRRLSLAGWEFRLPIGKDKNGDVMYAVPGKAMTFRVPDFEGPTVVGPCVENQTEGPTTVGPMDPEGPTWVGQGPTTVGGRPNHGWAKAQPPLGVGPTTVGPPSPSISFASPSSSPSSSMAEVGGDEPTRMGEVEGGGGGDDSRSRELAGKFASALDYRGRQPDRRQQKAITDGLTAALDAGWTLEDLSAYLQLGDTVIKSSAASLYVHRLKPSVLPDPPVSSTPGQAPLPPACPECLEWNPATATNPRLRCRPGPDGVDAPCDTCNPGRVAFLANRASSGPLSRGQQESDGWFDETMSRAHARMERGDWKGAGTDERVAGWTALSAQLRGAETPSTTDQRVRQAIEAGKRVQRQQGGHKPYSNDVWSQPADPAKAAKTPHCGDPDCDPDTRLTKFIGHDGQPGVIPCGACHPDMKF